MAGLVVGHASEVVDERPEDVIGHGLGEVFVRALEEVRDWLLTRSDPGTRGTGAVPTGRESPELTK